MSQACIKQVADESELEEARDLLWEHLEGRDSPLMRQTRPVGWKRGQPETWVEGHGALARPFLWLVCAHRRSHCLAHPADLQETV